MRRIQRTSPVAVLSAAVVLAVAGRARAGDLPEPAISLGPWAARSCPGPDDKALAAADGSSTSAVERGWDVAASLRPEEPGKRVNVSITPYAWLTSQAGDTTVSGITMDAGISFSELLDKSDTLFSLMGAIDVEYDRFVLQFLGEYSRVTFKGSRGVFRNGIVNADISESLARFELLCGYRVVDEPLDQEPAAKRRLTLDGFVGGRVTAVDLNSTLSASAVVTLPDGEVLNVGTTTERGLTKDWVEPFVGARLGLDLGERWSLSLRGDVGGFGVAGATFAWSAAALVGYRWEMDGWTLAAFGGYRVLEQDYSSGDFGWDVLTYGPLLGAQFSFSF